MTRKSWVFALRYDPSGKRVSTSSSSDLHCYLLNEAQQPRPHLYLGQPLKTELSTVVSISVLFRCTVVSKSHNVHEQSTRGTQRRLLLNNTWGETNTGTGRNGVCYVRMATRSATWNLHMNCFADERHKAIVRHKKTLLRAQCRCTNDAPIKLHCRRRRRLLRHYRRRLLRDASLHTTSHARNNRRHHRITSQRETET